MKLASVALVMAGDAKGSDKQAVASGIIDGDGLARRRVIRGDVRAPPGWASRSQFPKM